MGKKRIIIDTNIYISALGWEGKPKKILDKVIAGEYELETGKVIAERFSDINPEHFPGVLVSCHGPFAWGPNGTKAAETALAMELLAQMASLTVQINSSIKPIDQMGINVIKAKTIVRSNDMVMNPTANHLVTCLS